MEENPNNYIYRMANGTNIKVECKPIQNKPGQWNSLDVSIYRNDILIGNYLRPYHTIFRTFYPFLMNEEEYALYSASYQETTLVKLDGWEEIAKDTGGFCPTGYFVPQLSNSDTHVDLPYQEGQVLGPLDCLLTHSDGTKVVMRLKIINPTWGLVFGCYWGDDMSWKIHYLDLSRVDEGIIKRDERFGRIALPRSLDVDTIMGDDIYSGAEIFSVANNSVAFEVASRIRFNTTTGAIIHQDGPIGKY